VEHAEPTLHRVALVLPCILVSALALACGGDAESDTSPEVAVGEFIEDDRPLVPVPAPPAPRDHAVLEVEGHGEIRIELLADVAPQTVGRFTQLAESGFYDGTTFHRVLPGFMIQGGDPNSRNRDPRDDGLGSSGLGNVADEFSDISHVRGIVSLANRARARSGDCQFFLMVGDNPNLDGGYTVFGRIVAGQEVAEAISLVPRDQYGRWGPRDRPREDVVITAVRIEPAARAGTDESGPGNRAPDAAKTSVAAREGAG
jgi:peptidyl-prolyl cis-trans isomerase B (cyclophilin B)